MKKLKTAALAVLLILALTVTLVPFSASAAWNGSRSDKFIAGTGTEADPYLVGSAEDLAYLAYSVNSDGKTYEGEYFELTADIDISGSKWDPIGNYSSKTQLFKGIFDGKNHTVSGLSCEISGDYAGLFGRIESATVRNLKVTGALVSGVKYSGGIVGYGVKGSTVSNCTSKLDLVTGYVVGGIIGRIQGLGADGGYNLITCCFSESTCRTITGTSVFAGGIVGACGATVVSYCGNTGKVDIAEGGTTLACAGGIVGVQGADNATAHIRNCYNTGDISALSVVAATYAGGIVGRSSHIQDFVNYADVVDCFTTGKATVKDSAGVEVEGKFGSVIGHIRYISSVSNCYTTIPATECVEVGTDDFLSSVEAGDITVLSADAVRGSAAVSTMKLGEAWVANASGIPQIDVEKALPIADAAPETTAEPETTKAPETTNAPEADTTATPEPEKTDAPTTTAAPADETTKASGADTTAPIDTTPDKGGVNIFVILIIVVVVLAAGAIVFIVVSEKKKK